MTRFMVMLDFWRVAFAAASWRPPGRLMTAVALDIKGRRVSVHLVGYCLSAVAIIPPGSGRREVRARLDDAASRSDASIGRAHRHPGSIDCGAMDEALGSAASIEPGPRGGDGASAGEGR